MTRLQTSCAVLEEELTRNQCPCVCLCKGGLCGGPCLCKGEGKDKGEGKSEGEGEGEGMSLPLCVSLHASHLRGSEFPYLHRFLTSLDYLR